MLFKSFRARRAPSATLLVIVYLGALCPRTAWAEAGDERIERAQSPRTSAPLAPANAVAHEIAASATAAPRGAPVERAALDLSAAGDPSPAPPAGDPSPGGPARPPGGAPIGGQTIALPSGPGSVSGLGESFAADPSTGVGTLSIPVPLLPARGGMQPSLSVSYSSTSGSGVVGLGWSTGAPYIARQTERGIPRYDDRADYHGEQDRFAFNGAELVPLGVVRGRKVAAASAETMPAWSESWQYFRARIEGSYYRFFWSPDHRTWRVQAGQSGGTLELGVPLDGSGDDNALEMATEGSAARIFRWNVARIYDPNGEGKPTEDAQPKPTNAVVYRYLHDGGLAYLSDIYDTPPADGATRAPLAAFAHHTRLAWEARSDVSSSYRRGWRVEQRLRLKHVDLSSKTYTGAADPRRQVRRMHFGYDAAAHVSQLTSVVLEGRCDGDETGARVPAEQGDGRLPEAITCPTMPAMTLAYSHVQPASRSETAAGFEPFDGTMRDVAGSPPLAIDTSLGVMLADVDGDGLPDLLDGDSARNAGQHRVYLNTNAVTGAAFGPPTSAPIAPATPAGGGRIDGFDLSLKGSNVVPLDFDGDGMLDLAYVRRFRAPVIFSAAPTGPGIAWRPQEVTPDTSAGGPDLELARDRASTRVTDVNGDGLVDIVVSTGTELLSYLSLATYEGGHGAFGSGTRAVGAPAALSGAPIRACLPASNGTISFGDPRVQLADMNADGMADIVRLKRGHFEYWPSRGDGHWGTGDPSACAAGAFASPIVMEQPPFPSVADEEVRYGDLNGDALADAIAIEGTAVVVWLNIDGQRWSAPIAIPKGPFVGTAKATTQINDIDGSGTPDVVFGDAGHYRYIDLLGGTRPALLTTIDSGLGKTSTVEYTTSTAEMRRAAWKTTVPMVMPLVKRVTVADNLDRIGRAPGAYATSYEYEDPFFDRRGPSFRGFRNVTMRQIAGPDAVGQGSRTRFLLGDCADEDEPGRCAHRDRENPRDALRGLAEDVEEWDDRGNTLSTVHTTYRLRTLFTGLDGRQVRTAYGAATDVFAYETSPFVPGDQTVSLTGIERETAAGAVTKEPVSIVLKSAAGRVHSQSEKVLDRAGHVVESRARGCVEGCATPDETITTVTRFEAVPGDASGWLARPVETYVTGSRTQEPRHQMLYEYDPYGRLARTSAVLKGTLPLLRSHAGGKAIAPAPATAVKDGTILVSSQTYDPFGHAIDIRGAGNRCVTRTYDAAYRELAVMEVTSVGPVAADGCGARKLIVTATHDRGIASARSSIGYNGERGRVEFDAFGRTTAIYDPDPAVLGAVSASPSKTYEYLLPSSARPVLGVHARIHRGTTNDDTAYVDTWDYSDAMGRPLASIAPADKSNGDGGDWIVLGLADFDSRGRAIRAYEPWFWDGDPARFSFAVRPTTKHEVRDYDGFGRLVARHAVDGSLVERSVYHPLSIDAWDAADLATGSPHYGTYATRASDGHGRSVRSVERIVQDGALQAIETRAEYLPTGEVARIVRARAGASEVGRWMRYDSLGRMVLNAEPSSVVGFTAVPPTDVSALRAWRYAYDEAGEVVGTSDARGCGINYAYDAAGRMVAEDRSPCLDSQAAYSAPDLATGDGTEAFYRYDEPDPELAQVTAASVTGDAGAAPDASQKCPAPLANWLGRATSVSTLGAKAIVTFDGRGRSACDAARVVRPGAPSTALAQRYAPRWYVKRFAYDDADRLVASSTGARSPELVGADGQSVMRVDYTRRGDVRSVAGSYGTIVKSSARDALGLPQKVVYGDVAATTTAYAYDARNRLSAVQTVRQRPALWNGATGTYTPPPASTGEPTLQTVLEDGEIDYDDADNPTELRDNRDPALWPAGAHPVTRKVDYDDLYRATRVRYVYSGGSDGWRSPYAADLAAAASGRSQAARPSPHVSEESRVGEESFTYDWLGNVVRSQDDARSFYDRSLGTQTHATETTGGPYRLVSASNRDAASARGGDLAARYDEAGNLVDMVVRRDGACLPASASCWQRFAYEWSEVGELSRARRWDLALAERAALGRSDAPLPARAPDAELRYAYSSQRTRVLKTAVDAAGAERHDAYVFESLELRHAAFDPIAGDFELSAATETAYLAIGGTRFGRVYYAEHDVPSVQSGRQHVLLELRDHMGSTSIVIDRDTSELVERATYTAFGQAESDYRPARWDGFREPYRFTGKEDDAELGLVYIGQRYFAPALNRWISPDPLAVHSPGSADLNVYAYVHGRLYSAVDPTGLEPITLCALAVTLLVTAVISAAAASTASVVVQATTKGGLDKVDLGEVAISGGIGFIGGLAFGGIGAAGATLGWSGTVTFFASVGAQGTISFGGSIATQAYANNGQVDFRMAGISGLAGMAGGGAGYLAGQFLSPWANSAGTLTFQAYAHNATVGFADSLVTGGVTRGLTGQPVLSPSGIASDFTQAGVSAFSGTLSGYATKMLLTPKAPSPQPIDWGNGKPPTAAELENYSMVLATRNPRDSGKFSHSVVGIEANGETDFYHQVGGTRGDNPIKGGYDTEIIPKNDRFEEYTMLKLPTTAEGAAAAQAQAGSMLGPSGKYNILTNSCTTSTYPILQSSGLTIPIWARSPQLLRLWFTMAGAKPVK
jgi:RHS repeat-associated protein